MVGQKFLSLNDVVAYKISFTLSNYIWAIILRWDYLAQNTIGTQFVRSVDSISANIAEGFGRYGKKDKVKFYRYSLGSSYESLDWNEKSKARNLLLPGQYNCVLAELKRLPKEINHLIKFTNEKLLF